MAKYRATAESEKGREVSKLGNSRIETHTCTWNEGVRVIMTDSRIEIYRTGGSNNPSNKELLIGHKS